MVEASIGSLHFSSGISNPIPENGIVDEKRGHDDIAIQLRANSDIHITDDREMNCGDKGQQAT